MRAKNVTLRPWYINKNNLLKSHSLTDPSEAQLAILQIDSSCEIVAFGWKITAPTLQVWPFRVCISSQSGTDHTLQRPDLEFKSYNPNYRALN